MTADTNDRDVARDKGARDTGARKAAPPAQQGARTNDTTTSRSTEKRAPATRPASEPRGKGTTEDNARLARTLIKLWNARDFDQAARLVHQNVECVDVPFDQTVRGPDGYRENGQAWATAFPDGRIEITRVVASNEGAVVEYTGRGTHTGPLATPGGPIAPTNRRAELRLCDVLEIEQGKVRRFRSYYDAATLMRQLGISSDAGAESASWRTRQPSGEAIRERAFQIHEARGGAPGDAREDWLQAERELRAEA